MNTETKEGGAPAKVELTQMTKSHSITNVGTPIIEKPEFTFNPCFVLLGLHIVVQVKPSEFCQRPRCKKHRQYHPDKKDETKLEFVKDWEIASPRSSNKVTVAIWKCPRCGKKVRRYPRRESSK